MRVRLTRSGFLTVVGALVGAVFFLGGFYNIAADVKDPGAVEWALTRVRLSSVAMHADVAPPATIDDPALVQDGARAFAMRGCPTCHGAPGVQWQKFSEGLNPDPPDLKDVVKERTPAQLFFVVKHGIKMTGMPSFGAIGVDDKEIWSIVAFARKFGTVSDADFKAWTAPR
jgi:mono/diheme cytochrome c family protein